MHIGIDVNESKTNQVFGKDSDHFLRESCYMMMDQRAKSGTKRNDLIDTLLNLREEDKDKPFSYTNISKYLNIRFK